MKYVIILILVLSTVRTFSQSEDYSLGGYAKYLFSTVRYPESEKQNYDHLIHSRLNTKWFASQNLTGTMELRFRTYFGSSIKNNPGFLEQIKSYQPLIDMDALLWNTKNSIGYLEADRLYFDYYAGDLQSTIGRQRIAWGKSWVWNPMDIFNPKSVLDFDYEELPGVDALRFQYYTGAVSKIEIALAPAREKQNSSYAVMLTENAFDYDFSIMAGLSRQKWIVGTAWSGDIFDAGFRGEITYSRYPNRLTKYDSVYSLYNETAITANDNNVLRFVFSGDYTFPNSFYIHTEVLFNSNGRTKNAGLYYQEANQLGMLSTSRWSIFQELSYDITPLMRASVFMILNPVDNSAVLVPSIGYSVITNLDLYLTALLFNGKENTEFGGYGQFLYARLKWSF